MFNINQSQAAMRDSNTAKQIMTSDNPMFIKQLGRKVKNFNEQTWSRYRRNIVKQGNISKFKQNPYLLQKLYNTKNKTLVEASPYDNIWGIGLYCDDPRSQDRNTWKGLNLLGEILTEIREEFIKEI